MDLKCNTIQHIAIPLIFFLVGGGILAASYTIGWGNLDEPAPGMYPAIVGSFMIIFAISCMHRKIEIKKLNYDRNAKIRAVQIIGALFFWCIAMEYFGYVVVTLTASFWISNVANHEKIRFALLISIVITLFVYFLFDFFFYIDLPKGFWGM